MTLTDNAGRAWEALWVVQPAQDLGCGLRIVTLLARAAGDKRAFAPMVPDDSMALQITKLSTQSENK